MALLKSINENYKKLPSEAFYTPDQLLSLRIRFQSASSLAEIEELQNWLDVGLVIRLKYLPVTLGEDPLPKLVDAWQGIEPKTDRVHVIIVDATDVEWDQVYYQLFEKVFGKSSDLKLRTWLHLYYVPTAKLVNPFEEMDRNLFQRLRGDPVARAKRHFRGKEGIVVQLHYILGANLLQEDTEVMLEQGKVKEEQLQQWKDRLKQAKVLDEDEQVIEIAAGKLRRNHFSINSNFNKSGKFILTSKRLVFARRSFSIFGLSVAAIIPILAFVRPANKVILIVRTFWQYLKLPFQAAKPLLQSLWPAIAAVAVSINFIDFGAVKLSITNFFSRIPSLNVVGLGLNYTVEHPQVVLPALGGFYTLFRLGFLKAFFRRHKLIYLPLTQLNYAAVDGRNLVGRWKVKGHQLVRAKDGVQYQLYLRSYNKDVSNRELSSRFFVKLMDAAYSARDVTSDVASQDSSISEIQ